MFCAIGESRSQLLPEKLVFVVGRSDFGAHNGHSNEKI